MQFTDKTGDLVVGTLGFAAALVLSAYQPLWDRDSGSLWSSPQPLILFPLAVASLLFYRNWDRLLIWSTGVLLGLVLSIGILFWDYAFGIYLVVLAFFHFSEFLVTGLTNPQNLSLDSYLVNHSLAYSLAALASWLEHGLEQLLAGSWKSQLRLLTLAGLACCILGEIVRKMAMFHAGRNFNHHVQERKQADHRLVTTGIYTWCRHPSYAGWFLWSLGSQVILLNPFCLVAYCLVSFRFFKERIYIEEYSLLQFFGADYANYQRRVGTGIPFIQGYRLQGT